MVPKLPPAAQVTRIDASIASRLTIGASNLSADRVAPLMYRIQVAE